MKAVRSRSTAPGRGDDGVTLILFALAILGIMLIVALVIDLSNVRDTRQSNKSASDVAVAAGMRGLAGADGFPHPWGGVCKALDYLKLNHPEGTSITGLFKNGAGTDVGDPCDTTTTLYASTCDKDDATTWAWFSGTANGGRLLVDIKNGYETPDVNFPEDTSEYSGDDTVSPELGACANLAVILREVDPAFFGGAADQASYSTATRSVGRVTIKSDPTVAVALLLLEKTDCRALYTSGNQTYVLVKQTGADKPGYIQVNSDGSGCNGGQRVIEGGSSCGALNLCGTGPSIVAERSANKDGVIGNHAVGGAFSSFANTSACPNPTLPSSGCTIGPVPTDRGTVTRSPVDDLYLNRVTDLKTRAAAAILGANSDSSYYRVNGVGGCNGLVNKTVSATAPASATVVNTGGLTKVYLGCDFDTGSNNTTVFDSSITDVVTNGRFDVGSGGTLRLDGVERLYVDGSGANGIRNSGTLWVNSDPAAVRCLGAPNRVPDAANGTATSVTEMVIMSGELAGSSDATFHLCDTFVLMANGTLPSVSGTDPNTNGSTGRINFGSQGTVDWTAPNQTNSSIEPDNAFYDKFEDLALWTEYSGNCTTGNAASIGGQGALTATGVFFLPNACPFSLSGGGSGATIEADAQFVVRQLVLTGTVQLTMAPNPANVVRIPFFDSFRLVR